MKEHVTNLPAAAIAVLRGKYITTNAYIIKNQ